MTVAATRSYSLNFLFFFPEVFLCEFFFSPFYVVTATAVSCLCIIESNEN